MREVGDFILDRPLGSGATAQVFLATRKSNPGARVALKVFHPGVWDQEEQRKRILAEFRTVSSLRHPNIVQVHEMVAPSTSAQPPAVVMEFIDGTSLEEFQARMPYILPELAVKIMCELLAALSHAHAQGVIHRDLKPANILVRNDGRIYVSDFGLAKMRDVSKLTLSGTVLGSPDFMSPEQARGEPCSPRSDLFSAASILYFLVTGTKPFSRHTPLATLAAVNEATPESAQRRNPKISARLARIIHRGLDKNSEARFASADEFGRQLAHYLADCGMADFALTAWHRSPNEVTLDSLKQMAEALAVRAKHEIGTGQLDSAWESVDHLSLVAPESNLIAGLLQKIDRKRRAVRVKRLAAPSAVLVATALLVLGAGYFWRTKPPVTAQVSIPPPQEAVRAQAPAPAPVPMKAANVPATPVRDQVRTSRAAPAAKKAPLLRKGGRVEFSAAEEILVYWDGKKVPSKSVLTAVNPGFHTLRLEKPGSPPMVREVEVALGEPTQIKVE
ncbi:MAG: serine/threonine-protein kinase [Bdellovibrionota bacterium]